MSWSPMWRVLLSVLLVCLVLGTEVPDGQTQTTDGYGGPGSSIPAIATEGKPATVIVLHGLGGTGQEWATLFLPVSLLSLTYVKFILPTAPLKPVTYLETSMPSWFDIESLGPEEKISRGDLFASTDRVNNIVEGEIKAGTPSNRIFIMGFSQGGAVALTTFLRSRYTLGGCMAVATWLPLRGDYPTKLSSKIKERKTLMIHVSDMGFSLMRALTKLTGLLSLGRQG